MLSAQLEQASVKRQHRARITVFDRDVVLVGVCRDRQPGIMIAEARVGRRIPLHGRTARVSSQAFTRHVLLQRVLYLVCWDGHIVHADLIAVIQGRRTAQGQQYHARYPGLGCAHSRGDARVVMVAKHPVRPAADRQRRLIAIDQAGDAARIPRRLQQLKIER